MSGTEILVLAAAAASIGWVNWFFFLAQRKAEIARVGAGGVQEITIGVRGGYDPATIKVKRGVPVRLVFDRQEASGCSEEIVFPDFAIRRFLPAYEKTRIEIAPQNPGTYEFTCGMSMLRGKLIVE